MNVKYSNKIYGFLTEDKELLTYKKEKTDETFEYDDGIYYKQIEIDDKKIEEIYDVDFYVYYMDNSETLKKAGVSGKWCVDEGRPLYRMPDIEKDELGLWLGNISWSEDWIHDDKCSCSKIVNLYDCSNYTVKYTYIFKDGKELPGKEIVEVKMDAEDFKAEMIKYRLTNI